MRPIIKFAGQKPPLFLSHFHKYILNYLDAKQQRKKPNKYLWSEGNENGIMMLFTWLM